MMKSTLALALAGLLAVSGPAFAAGKAPDHSNAGGNGGGNGGNAGGCSDAAPGQNQDELILFYTLIEPTGSPTPGGVVDNLGGALSGGFYGNTANSGIDSDAPDNGHGVTPSISPGPQTVGGGGPGTGTSIGEFIHTFC